MNRKQRRQSERAARQVNQQPGSVVVLLQSAVQQHRAGAHEHAEALYRQVLAAAPHEFNALNLLGTLLDHTGRSEEGLRLLNRAAKINAGIADVWNNLGVAYARFGHVDEAVKHYQEAIRLRPDYADAHRNLGFIRFRQKDNGAARAHLESALPAYANDQEVLSILARACQLAGDPLAATSYANRALQHTPQSPAIRYGLALMLSEIGQWDEALLRLIEEIPHQPNSEQLQFALERVLHAKPPDRYIPELEQTLITCFDSPYLVLQRLTRYAAHQLRLKYRQQGRLDSPASGRTGAGAMRVHLDGILADQLLIRLLRQSVNCDPGLELFLTALRRTLLFSAASQPTLSQDAMRFMASLAMQCHHNSYVFMVEPAETEALDGLAKTIARDLQVQEAPDATLETKLALYAMYRPLNGLVGSERLEGFSVESWTDEIRPLIKLALLNRLEETRLRQQIPAIVAIDDETSRIVQSQYEENPYPRWITLPNQGLHNLGDHLQQRYPHFNPPHFLSEPLEILVAGCGTGQHPLSVARQYSNVQVTAVDLSRASLAYARRMAASLDVNNIEFFQGDILRLAQLDRQFPVIECSGVLHHMREPDAGLAVLTRLLRPGGVMKLGLYSELARQWIVAARARITELGLQPNPEAIRGFRGAILAGQELPGSNLMGFGDFYDLDSCRDLIFHVQEHRYTFAQLETFLSAQSLRLVGIIPPSDDVLRRYGQAFPEDPEMTDFDCWARFEEEHPFTFSGMYQFWCQKPAWD